MAKTSADSANLGLLQCVVVTPERTQIDQKVEFVAVPLFDGEVGILPGHTPLVGRLGFGELRTRLNGITERTFVDGGFVQVQDDVVTILTSNAMQPNSIEVDGVEEQLKAALALPATTDAEQSIRLKAIARARAMLRSAEKSA